MVEMGVEYTIDWKCGKIQKENDAVQCPAEFIHLCWILLYVLHQVHELGHLIPIIQYKKSINAVKTRHRASTSMYSLTFRVRTMLSYCEVEASLLVGWLVEVWRHFSAQIRLYQKRRQTCNYGSRYIAIATQPVHRLRIRPIVHN